MPELLDETDTNLLIQHDDGEIELVSLSPMNRLLFEHDLWGILRRGDEVLYIAATDETPAIHLVPDDDCTTYTLRVGEYEPLHLGPHHKSRLIDALVAFYTEHDGDDPTPLLALFDSIREQQVRQHLMNAIGDLEPFNSAIAVKPDGWLIHGHLLLTWEGDFHHPETTSRRVAGSGVQPGSAEAAYQLRVSSASDGGQREITVGGQTYRLSNAEMEFIARALWAVMNAPQ